MLHIRNKKFFGNIKFFYILSQLFFMVFKTVESKRCFHDDDCSWCGLCTKQANNYSICIYPFTELTESCREKDLCWKNPCHGRSKCIEIEGYSTFVCDCGLTGFYGRFCEFPPDSPWSRIYHATGIAVLQSIKPPEKALQSIFTVTVIATAMYPGRDLRISATTKEGYTVWLDRFKGSCFEFSCQQCSVLHPYSLHCQDNLHSCERSFGDKNCESIFASEVIFPFKPTPEPGVGSVDGYVSSITVKAHNGIKLVFDHEYPVLIRYKDYNIDLLNDSKYIPEVKINNCNNHYSKQKHQIYFRRNIIQLEAIVTYSTLEFKGTSDTQTLWRLYELENDSEKPMILRYYKISSGYGSGSWLFDPFTLKVGSYKVVLVVSNSVNRKRLSNFGNCYFQVINRQLVAVIDGGRARSVSPSELYVSGRESYNPNVKNGTDFMQFSWNCEPKCNHFVQQNKNSFKVPSNLLKINNTYTFRLKLTYLEVTSPIAIQDVFIVEDNLSVDIHCLYNCLEKVIPTDPFMLRARVLTIDSFVPEFTWTYKIGNEIEQPADTIRDQTFPSYILSIDGNVLQEGKSYYFTAKLKNRNAMTAFEIITNKKPTIGRCQVTPSKGVALKTLFEIICSGFEDDNQVLIYEFYDKKETNLSKEFSDRMIASNNNGELNGVKLAKGLVVVVYNIFGYSVESEQEVDLEPFQGNSSEIYHFIRDVELQLTYVQEFEFFPKISLIPNLMRQPNNFHNVIHKTVNLLISFNVLNQGVMKLVLSAINRTVSSSVETENKINLSLTKTILQLINKLAYKFKLYTKDFSAMPYISLKTMNQLLKVFLNTIEETLIDIDKNYLTINNIDTSALDFSNALAISMYTAEFLEKIGEAQSFRSIKMFKKSIVQSSKGLITISSQTGFSYELIDAINIDNDSLVQISPFLKRFILQPVTNFETNKLTFRSTTIHNSKPFLIGRTDLSTYLLELNIYRTWECTAGCPITDSEVKMYPFKVLNYPIDMYFKESTMNSGVLKLTVKQLDKNNTSNDEKDNSVLVVRIYLQNRRSKLFIKLSFQNETDQVLCRVSRYIRPDYELMLENSRVLSNSEPYYHVPYKPKNGEGFIYIGFLPGPNVTAGGHINFTLHYYHVLCLAWIRYIWQPRFCTVGTNTFNSTVHCKCSHLSIFSAVIATPPHELDPFGDLSLFLSIRSNFYVPVFVLSTMLALLLLCFWARCRDRQESSKRTVLLLQDNLPGDEYCYILTVFTGCRIFAGTEANVGIKLIGELAKSRSHILKSKERRVLQGFSEDWFLMLSTEHLGVINTIHLWHDSSGLYADWYCDKIVVFDMQNFVSYTFIVEQWIALGLNQHSEAIVFSATSDELKHLERIFLDNLMFSFRETHILGHLLLHHPRSRMTRLDRSVIIMAMTFFSMMLSIAFYKSKHRPIGFDEYKFSIGTIDILITVQSFLIMTIVFYCIVLLFQKSYKARRKDARIHQSILQSNLSNIIVGSKQDKEFVPHEPEKKRSDMSLYEVFVRTIRRTYTPLPYLPVALSQRPQTFPRNNVWYAFAWSACILITLICAYLVALYGLKFKEVMSKKWLSYVLIMAALYIFVLGPTKILLLAFLLAISTEQLFSVSLYDIEIKDDFRLDPSQQEYSVNYALLMRTRHHSMYRPLYRKEREQLKVRRLEKKTIIRCCELFLFALFIFFLHLMTLDHLEDLQYNANQHVRSLVVNDLFANHTKFSLVKNSLDLNDYLRTTFLYALYEVKWYNNNELKLIVDEDTPGCWAHDYILRFVGPPTIRQLRVKRSPCSVNKLFQNSSITCIQFWNADSEDKDDYGLRWTTADWGDETWESPWIYHQPSELSNPVRSGVIGTNYHGGGYIANLSWNRHETEIILRNLRKYEWIDKWTRVVFVIFTLFNVNTDLFTEFVLKAEHMPYGEYLTVSTTKSVKINMASSSKWIVSICLFIFIVICFIISSLLRINRHGKAYFSKLENVYHLFITVLGVAGLTFYFLHLYDSRIYIENFQRQGVDEFFHFYQITKFAEISYRIFEILFCCLIMGLISLLPFGRGYLSSYYNLCKRTASLLLASISMFIALTFVYTRLLSRCLYSLKLFSNTFCNWIESTVMASDMDFFEVMIVIHFNILVKTLCTTLILVVFTYHYKLARIKRENADKLVEFLKKTQSGLASFLEFLQRMAPSKYQVNIVASEESRSLTEQLEGNVQTDDNKDVN